MLQGKKIILGITGGIAAYKCPHLVRLLVKRGAEVRVILTRPAASFVTAETLGVVSKNEVLQDFFDAGHNWVNHVELAEWADLIVVAPLTANTLAKMAAGLCDNLLLATWLSARSLTVVAPAMDLEMYRHATVKANIESIKAKGTLVIPPAAGELASGLEGEGRMPEPEEIVAFLEDQLSAGLSFRGLTALVNAGPTYEAIDPVRFIGNRSSGKMGLAVAEELAARGAKVTLVMGPSHEKAADKAINVVNVESSDDMYSATMKHAGGKDIVVCTAAVADYKPAEARREKIKKTGDKLSLDLVRTRDILAELGRQKSARVLVGFALETGDLIRYAQQKLEEKNLDLIVANAANEAGSGFGGDTNRIAIIGRHNKITNFELKSKRDAARDIADAIAALLGKK